MVCLMFIFLTFTPSILYLLVVSLMMRLATRFLGQKAAVVIGIIAICFIIYLIVDLVISCRAEPIYIPPEEGVGGEEMMIFPCDAPVGMFVNFWIDIAGPLTVVAHTIPVFCLNGKSKLSVGVHCNKH